MSPSHVARLRVVGEPDREVCPTCGADERSGCYCAMSLDEDQAAASAKRYAAAMGELTLAIGNVVQAIRQQQAYKSPLDIHPFQAERFHAAGLEAVLRQFPAANLEAINDAGEELRQLVDQAVTDPEAAVINDPERMKDACCAWVRKAFDAFRAGLAAQLPTLRGGQ